jgi:hypothetical protein
MRVYKFLDAHFGIKVLYEKRLKVSTIDDLNDPFELLPYDLTDVRVRWAMRATRTEMARTLGLLCFSAAWDNPVIWAHYADKHKGICLGFDADDALTMKVEYRSERLPFLASGHPTEEDMVRMVATKFASWEYEKEIRVWVHLKEEEGGVFYRDFDGTEPPDLKLVEVIAGAECQLPEREFRRALPAYPSVKLIKARAGFTKFEVVENQQGFSK